MMKYLNFKSTMESILIPIAKHINVNPSLITFFSILSGFACLYYILNYEIILAVIFFCLAGFFDALDGMVAKTHGKTTNFGQVFDRFADRVVDMTIISAFILSAKVQLDLGLLILTTIVLGSYLSACMEAVMKSKIGEGLSLRPFRFILMFFAILVPAGTQICNVIFVLLAVMGLYAVLARLKVAIQILNK